MSAEPQTQAADTPQIDSMAREDGAEEWQKRAEELFKAFPVPKIQKLPPEDALDLSKYQNKPKIAPAEALQKCSDALEKYDEEECKAHREEIDTLLVFAGLFSAVVTAFSIESYQWLQSDPNDAIIALLTQIAHPTNQTAIPTPKGLSGAVSTRINAYWFLSLALSLSAALVAIVCKQWVREFERHTGLSDAAQFIGVRQMKLEGFEAWRVAGVVATIPLLLQCALGLFALGLVELLWNLHPTVAIVILIPTTAALVFYSSTTLLPGVQAISSPFGIFRRLPQCPFKSSQAMLALRSLVLLRIIVRRCFSIAKIVWKFISTHLFRFWHPESPPDSGTVREGSRSGSTTDSPQSPSDAEEGSVGSGAPVATNADGSAWSLWRSFVRFWLRSGAHRCHHREPVRTIRLVTSRFWRYLTSWMQNQDWPLPRSSDSARQFPAFKQTVSWLGMDQAFTSLRDEAYSLREYEIALQNWGWTQMPPSGCFYRGLSWLRAHVHQPEMESWIFGSIWERMKAAQRLWPYDVSFEDSTRLRYGIHATIDPTMDNARIRFDPTSQALYYAKAIQLEPSFIAEAAIHHLSSLDEWAAIELLQELYYRSKSDGDTNMSVLHAIIAFALKRGPTGSRTDIMTWLLYPRDTLFDYPRTLSHPTFACVIAIYLRELHLEIKRPSEAGEVLGQLWQESIKHLGSDEEPNMLTAGPSGEKAVYAALALAIHHRLEYRSRVDRDLLRLAHDLVQPRNREVYLDLLSTALGSADTAEAHFERTIARWLPGSPSTAPSPTPPERRSPEISQDTELYPTEQEGESSSSTGAGHALAHATSPTPMQEAPARRGTDYSEGSAGSA